jgi:hypothetical protein
MDEAVDTANILETLETGADAKCEPDAIRGRSGTSLSMGKHPERLLADSRERDTEYNNHQPLFGGQGISKSGQAV